MITLQELNEHNYSTTSEIDANLLRLLLAMNKVRAKWAHPMIVSSGLRSTEKHIEIYKAKGISEDKVPMGSQHLHGNAVDIADPNGVLFQWCQENEDFLKEAGIGAIELGTKGWVHFQTVPTALGHFWFNP